MREVTERPTSGQFIITWVYKGNPFCHAYRFNNGSLERYCNDIQGIERDGWGKEHLPFWQFHNRDDITDIHIYVADEPLNVSVTMEIV